MMKRIVSNSFSIVAITNSIVKPLWMLLFIFAARVLGPEQFGIYYYSFSISTSLFIFFDLGLDYLLIRNIAQSKERTNQELSELLYLRSLSFLITTGLTVIFNFFYIKDSIVFYSVILLLSLQFSTSLLTSFKNIYSANNDFKNYSLFLFIEKLGICLLGFLSLIICPDVLFFIVALNIANIITGLYILNKINNNIGFKFQKPQIAKTMVKIKSLIPIILMNIFILGYFRLDTIILEYLTQSEKIVGIYGALHRILEMYLLFPTILLTVGYPFISKSYIKNKDAAIIFAERLFKIIIFISVTIAMIISTNSYQINYIIFGKDYIEGYKAIGIIIWCIVPLGINYLLGHLIISIDKQKYLAISVGITSIISIILNFIFVPKYNFIASSTITLVSEVVIMIFYSFYVLKYFGKIKLISHTIRTLIICCIILIVEYIYITTFSYSLMINIFVISFVSVLCFLLSKSININDLKIMFGKNENWN